MSLSVPEAILNGSILTGTSDKVRKNSPEENPSLSSQIFLFLIFLFDHFLIMCGQLKLFKKSMGLSRFSKLKSKCFEHLILTSKCHLSWIQMIHCLCRGNFRRTYLQNCSFNLTFTTVKNHFFHSRNNLHGKR